MIGSLSYLKIFIGVIFIFKIAFGFSQIPGVSTKCDEIDALDSKLFKHSDSSLLVESEFYDSIINLNGKEYTGKVKICENGLIRSIFSYTYGRFDGDIFLFSKNGILLEKSTYKMGHFTFIESYYENGDLQRKGGHVNGKRDGVWLFYYPNMRIQTIEDYTSNITATWYYFYENGQLMETNRYNQSKKDGNWLDYYENGQMMSIEIWTDNKKTGQWIYYYENGAILRIENYENDKENGNWIEYFENGNLKNYSFYKDGLYHGESKEYYENGQLKSVINYLDGQENGSAIFYDEKGKVYCTMEYKKSVPVSHKGKCW